ncbi:MAG: MBL fold metallo-hydrolase [Chloroflexi bacterium]|nr:MBL fold metallo-hydrolase [Chloroflexota bacterium]
MPERVSLDWLGCATFRLTRGNLVVFLDAYIDRVPSAPPTGVTTSTIDRADWIVVGHSHFDHLWGAERVALRTGATIIGSYESIRIMAEQGVPDSQLMPVSGGERIRLSEDVIVGVHPGLHSCIWTHTSFAAADDVCTGDLDVLHQDRLERLRSRGAQRTALSEEARAHLHASQQGSRGDGGALLYRFELPEGSLLYQDTCGYWPGLLEQLQPDVAILAAAGRGNVGGEPVQGSLAEFVAEEVAQLHPRRLFLGHHDDWLPGVSAAVDTGPIRREVTRAAPQVELIEMPYCAGVDVFK